MKKQVLSIILTVSIVISAHVSMVFAENVTSNNEFNASNCNAILEKAGFNATVISDMDNDKKNKISESIVNNPSSVQVNSTVLNVDNLAIFEYYTNTQDTDLLKNGVSSDDIKKVRANLDQLNSLSPEQFKEKYSVSTADYKMIKKSLTKNPNYKLKKSNNLVTTSGTISSSTLYYNMSVTNKSTSTAPYYSLYMGYSWYSTYFTDLFTDYLAVAWGGGLNAKNVEAKASYYYGNYFTSWGSFENTYNWSQQQTPQVGIVFSTPQMRGDVFSERQNRCGYVSMDLYQTKFQGYDTNVVSQFCHSVLTVNGGSVSVGYKTGYATINVGTGFDTTPQISRTVRY